MKFTIDYGFDAFYDWEFDYSIINLNDEREFIIVINFRVLKLKLKQNMIISLINDLIKLMMFQDENLMLKLSFESIIIILNLYTLIWMYQSHSWQSRIFFLEFLHEI